MDTFIASQIAIWMLVATLFGFAVGWLARGRGAAKARAGKINRTQNRKKRF